MIREQEEKSDISPEIAKKTINDEFEVSSYALEGINKALDKANKSLRARGLKELRLNVLGKNTKEIQDPDGIRLPSRVTTFKIKIEGEVPDIHDYEFIAKIEHTEAGNIINMNPSIPVEKLPAEYKTSNQRCDICKTNRERNNTFIIKKLETGEFVSAGSTCLKKFMPLDAVKAFLELAVQLEVMRNLLVTAEASPDDGDDTERGGRRGQPYFDPEDFLTWMCIAYLSKGKKYISKKKAQEWSTEDNYVQSTMSTAYNLMTPHYGYKGAEEDERERQETINRYKAEATDMAKKILDWMQAQDFDQMAVDNPNMENYFNNMKVLARLPYINEKNAGYYSSFLALYLRATKPKIEPSAEKKQSEFVSKVGEKIELNVILKSVKGYDSQYGWVNIYNLEDENGNKLVWFSVSSASGFWDEENQKNREGEKFKIKGTVKNQQVSKYNNQKETVLTRVKVLNKLEEQEIESKKPRLVMAIGISGSGKSSYIKKHFHPDTVVTPDEIRKQMTGDISNHSMEPQVWSEVSKRVTQSLKDNGVAVLDATNVDSGLRLKFLKNYPSAEKIALVFKVDPEVAKSRIAKDLEKGTDRSRVPPEIVDKQYKKLMAGYGNLPQQFDKVEYIGESKMMHEEGEHMANTLFTEPNKPRVPNANAGGELPEAKKGQGNLHGDERTQKQFVIDLAKAKKDGLQTISISEIATALHVPNKMISGTYARLIRYFNDRPNLFRMVIPGEPFRQEAIYQYIGEEPKKYLTADDIEAKEAEQKERELFKTLKTGKYYFVYRDKDGENVGAQLHLKAWENPEDVKLADGFRLGENYETKEYIRSTVFTLDQLDALNVALRKIQNVGTIHEAALRKQIQKMIVETIKEIYRKQRKNKINK